MKHVLIALFLSVVLAIGANPIRAISWKPNPPEEKVKYQVWKITTSGDKLMATVSGPPFRPKSHGTYFLRAVNLRGQSDKSNSVKP